MPDGDATGSGTSAVRPGAEGERRGGHAALPAAVLFDCDGVLVDTEVTSSEVLAAMLTEHGAPVAADELRTVIKGTSLGFLAEESARRLGGELPEGWMDDFVERRLVRFREGVPQIPGAADAVRAVREAGIPFAVASQGARSKMAVTLPASGLDDVLGDVPIFSGDDVERGKPHPDLYLLAAEHLGVDPAACVVVEDSVPGATGAVAAGMRVLGLLGDVDPEAMAAVGAEPLHAMADVPGLLGLAPSA